MNMAMRKFMLGSSTVAMVAAMSFAATSANAQSAGENPGNTETVTVTGSLITIQGYSAPTPVTVIDAAQLSRDANLNVVESLTKLPSVGQSETPNNGKNSGDLSQGDAALGVVNLRNLGICQSSSSCSMASAWCPPTFSAAASTSAPFRPISSNAWMW